MFKNKKVVLPVIHVDTPEQAERNFLVCLAAKAEGVFLINHKISDEELLKIAYHLKSKYDTWIGINCLRSDGVNPESVALDAVWTDNAFPLIGSNSDYAKFTKNKRQGQKTLYFEGVAFKYQPPVENLEETCKLAATFVNVVTTSGVGTGSAPDVEKIKTIKGYIGDCPLAVASGITADNIKQFLPYVDFFLVATGISKTFSDIDLDKLKVLIGITENYTP